MPAPSLVVPVNSTTSAGQGISTLGANNDAITLDCSNYNTIAIDFTGTFVATVSYDSSVDGATFSPHQGVTNGGATGGTSRTTTGQVIYNVAGINFLRLKITAYTSGSVVVTWSAVAVSLGPIPILLGSSISPGGGATSLGKAEDAAHTTGDIGVFMLGVRNDTNATFTSNDSDYSPIKVDGSGQIYVVSSLPSIQAGLGISQHRVISAGSTNATVIKGASGVVSSIHAANINAAIRYIKFYNKATTPTIGTDTPVLVIAVPPSGTVTIPFPAPMPFGAGIGYGMVTGITDADATAVAANEILMTVVYK